MDFPVRVQLRVVSPKEVLFQPQEEWDSSLNSQRPENNGSLYDRLQDFGVSCKSNLFHDISVENYPVEKLLDSICRLTFPDDQATQFDLSWTSKSRVGQAVVQNASGAIEDMEVQRSYPDLYEISLATQIFDFPQRQLHFPELPVTVQYQQRVEMVITLLNRMKLEFATVIPVKLIIF